MITITMMDGTCRQYNSARVSEVQDGFLFLAQAQPMNGNAIAKIRLSEIKMWEWTTPCRVYKPTKPRSKR